MPKASICISAFNKPTHLKAALKSICTQIFDYEIIVVDDGSANSEISKVCCHFPVKCIRIERQPIFRNPCVARNAAYKAALGDIIIAQSDEVVHTNIKSIELLCSILEDNPNSFVIANVFNKEKDGTVTAEFTGLKRQKPFFFLGALWRRDLYAVGGNDEEFSVCTGYEDAWFAECLIQGLKLQPHYTTNVVGHHLWHPNYNLTYDETISKQLYEHKMASKIFVSTGGPWPFIDNTAVTGTAQKIFTKIFLDNTWGGGESKSGAGSTIAATDKIRKALPHIFDKYRIASALDLPCGDYNWMKEVAYSNVKYIGADIVAPLIEECRSKYVKDFRVLDLLTSNLPKTDLIICRDCLVHFSVVDIKAALANIKAAGIKYILTTTFTARSNDKSIATGQWTPYNLQKFPFNFPEPIELINEDCQEWYPYFQDKSMGLWEVAEIEKALFPTKALTVCVEYDDFLAITLPRNMRHFSEVLVVTSTSDIATQNLCAHYNVRCHATDVFYANGASFNKGAAVEEGFDVLGRDGWICVWDVDIVMPENIYIKDKDIKCLYSPVRRILNDPSTFTDSLDWSKLPSPTQSHEFSGFFQLFHASSQATKPWYGIQWKHAGGCDSDFQFKFHKDNLKRLPFDVLHLGPEGIPECGTRIGRNWLGRVQPRLDTGELPEHSTRRDISIKTMVQERKKYGTDKEKIAIPSPVAYKIPKVINFFWTGKMSWCRYLTLLTFTKLNPEWTVNLHYYSAPAIQRTWASGETDDTGYLGYDYMQDVSKLSVNVIAYEPPKILPPAHLSDIFQWQILGSCGGFYADMDIIWLKPLSVIADANKDADAIFSLERGNMAIGFFGAIPNCQIFKDLYNAALASEGKTYQHYGTDLIYQLFNRNIRKLQKSIGDRCLHCIREKYKQLNIVDINDKLIYPLDWRDIKYIFEEDYVIYEGAVGLHWFAGAPISQQWNRLLTNENWRYYVNTFTTKLKTVL